MGSSPVGAGNPLPAVDYGQGLYAVQLAAGVGGLTQQSAAVLGPRPISGAEKTDPTHLIRTGSVFALPTIGRS